MEAYQEPKFYEGVHHYPPYKGDGQTPNLDKSYQTNVARRQFATPETAEWVARLYKADWVGPRTYLGMGEAFDENEESVKQYWLTIRGVDMVAGELAYYFSKLPADYQAPPIPNDPGMWPADLPDEEVMKRGKTECDKWVESSIQHTDQT